MAKIYVLCTWSPYFCMASVYSVLCTLSLTTSVYDYFSNFAFYGIVVLLLNVHMTVQQHEFLWSSSLSGIMT